jgi:hypothetical protein
MARITNPKGRVVPEIPKAVQAGNPHTSALDIGLSRDVITTWYESIRQPCCFPFPNPDTAPSVDIVSSFTDYTFAFKDGTWDDPYNQPWVVGDDADTVHVHLALVTATPLGGLTIRAESVTLIAAVSTVIGAMKPVPWGNPERIPTGPWWQAVDDPLNYDGNYLLRVDLEIHDPDLTPGGGEVALVFKAQWRPTGETVSNAEQVNCNLKIFQASVWNEIRDLGDY